MKYGQIIRRYSQKKTFMQKITDLIDPSEQVQGSNFSMITADQLKKSKTKVLNSQMLSRDFIEDSLYNPYYGYFSKRANIFSVDDEVLINGKKVAAFDFSSFTDTLDFTNYLADKYHQSEFDLSEVNDITRQVWHTPTELFKLGIKDDLIIYEIGAGNGTMMINILDYIRDTEPNIYKKTYYRIIEISNKLTERQMQSVLMMNLRKAHRNVNIINKSVFEWDQKETQRCFVIAMEDNFSHDVVRYQLDSGFPVQGVVLVDQYGRYEEVYEPVSDPLIIEYLKIRDKVGHKSAIQTRRNKLIQGLPFIGNLSQREYIPTRTYEFLKILSKFLPNHKLILSDFYCLNDTIDHGKSINAPVVQTRYRNLMVPCSTYMLEPGWFDIFFPTNFELLSAVYEQVNRKKAHVCNQKTFLKTFANLSNTVTKSGENVMLVYYENNKFLLT